MRQHILDIREGTKEYPLKSGSVVALKDINLQVDRGQVVSVLGPSGCGKTTLLEIVAGLRTLTGGQVLLQGEPVTGPSPKVGIVFQQDSTLPWRTVLSNIAFGMEMTGVSRSEAARRAEEMLDLVGLTEFADAHPHQLSGGMRQRVAVARVLAMEPELIVMDEPFGALDEQTRLRLGLELLDLVSRVGSTILLVTHSIQESALLSDRVVVLSARPGAVRETYDVPIPKPRTLATLASIEYARFTHTLWSCLMDIEGDAAPEHAAAVRA
ncbi:ABC transporter ATP-binding protein [Pseudonocardia sichuanensis]